MYYTRGKWVAIVFLLFTFALPQSVDFVMGGRSPHPNNLIVFSSDAGATWQQANFTFQVSVGDTMHVNSVAYSAEQQLWVACGGSAAGLNLPNQSMAVSFTGRSFNQTNGELASCLGIAWGFNAALLSGMWVATGVQMPGSNTVISYSANGMAWLPFVDPVLGAGLDKGWDVVYSSFHDLWVVVGASSTQKQVWYSKNPSLGWTAANWLISPPAASTVYFRVAVSPVTGAFVALSDGLSIGTSNDGTFWVEVMSSGDSFIGLTNDGTKFISSETSNTYFSDDGFTLSMPANAAGVNVVQYLCYSARKSAYVATGSSNNAAYSIVPRATSWTLSAPSNLFVSQSEGCAGSYESRLITSSPAPSSVLLGNSVVAGQNVTIIGNFTVFGSLKVGSSFWTVNSDALVAVSLNLTIVSSTTFVQGGLISVGDVLDISSRPSLQVASGLTGTGMTNITVARYQSVRGEFSVITANTPSPNCVSSATPTYSTSSLTVTVQVSCKTQSSNEDLSSGAIVGIVVGSVCGGVLLAVLIVLISKYIRNAQTSRMQRELKTTEFDNLKKQ